ncbi:hypothetical protein PoB_005769600 [Plakobranchus ocellatus]|uniref:Uncharacterized protein n=1 Tax=Plakobranchus ocellatus TaxID=259542 RepID=A0AAV4CEJ5_9GAST|nr:hypothetical protein PoB_005769600 [Plakobranchus ocellatus]
MLDSTGISVGVGVVLTESAVTMLAQSCSRVFKLSRFLPAACLFKGGLRLVWPCPGKGVRAGFKPELEISLVVPADLRAACPAIVPRLPPTVSV